MADVFTTIFLGISIGFCFGVILSSKKWRRKLKIDTLFNNGKYADENEVKEKEKSSDTEDEMEEDLEFGDWGDYKMVLVVRQDLGMGKGKAAAQCCHAAVAVYNKTKHRHPKWLREWEMSACPKIVLKAQDEETLIKLAEKAHSLDLDVCVIKDAGRTQIAPGSKTVMGLGPAPADLIDQVTGKLKLF